MKKIKPVFLAVLVGCSCAFVLFTEFEERTEVAIAGNAVAVQIGVFTKEENAFKMSDAYGGIVQNDGGIYRVYYSVLSKDENIEFITNYLDSNGVNYYLKKITLDDDILSEAIKYEEMMQKTSEDAKIAINKELLEMYEDVI